MSTTTATRPDSLTPAKVSGHRDRKPGKRKLLVAVCGAAVLGAFPLADLADTDSPRRPAAPAAVHPALQVQPAPAAEVSGGCLNDIECYGEPSHRPAG